MDVEKTVAELKALTEKETNEAIILQNGNALLSRLRKHWHTAKADFPTETIAELKGLGKLLNTVNDFIDELEEFPYLQTQEDVDESIANLYDVVEQTQNFAVFQRVLKEIRELAAKRNSLPNRKEKLVSQVVTSVIRKLTPQAPDCNKCGSKMRLRDGRGYYFWGCSTFPTCWSRKYLKEDELALFEK